MRICVEFFIFLLFKVYLCSILPIMVYQSLFWYFQLMDLNDIFIIKNLNGYRTVLLARPTVGSPKWISVFLMQPLSIYMNSFQFKLGLYHLPYGRFFDIHFMTDSPLKIFATPPFLPPWHDAFIFSVTCSNRYRNIMFTSTSFSVPF